jgi:Tol biopolymer transport system component
MDQRFQRSVHRSLVAVLAGQVGAFGCTDYVLADAGIGGPEAGADAARDAQDDVNMLDGGSDAVAEASGGDGSVVDGGSDVTVIDAGSDATSDTGVADAIGDAAIVVPQLAVGANELINVATGGAQANGDCDRPRVSMDLRFVVFSSTATNLVTNDTNAASDVFIRDRALGTTKVVSVTLGGAPGNGLSDGGNLALSGLFVAFTSSANNLVTGDGNGKVDAFVYNVATGSVARASLGSGGGEGDGDSDHASVSNDGRYVAFDSVATNLVVGDTNAQSDVFLRDRMLNTTLRISAGIGGSQTNGPSRRPQVTADGLFVAFESDAGNLVSGDTNGVRDVFVYAIGTQAITRVSHTGTVEGNGVSERLVLAGTSQFGIFRSAATNLIAGDTNNLVDLFRVTNQTPRAYVRLTAGQSSFPGVSVSISNDGNFVAAETPDNFNSVADQNSASDVWLYNLSTLPPASPTLLSVSSSGNAGNGASTAPFLAPDGSHVVYRTLATNLKGTTDTNGSVADIILNRSLP